MNQKEAKVLAQPVVDAILKEFGSERYLEWISVFSRLIHDDISIKFPMEVVTERDFGKLLGLKCATGVIDLRLEISVVPYTNTMVHVEILVKP